MRPLTGPSGQSSGCQQSSSCRHSSGCGYSSSCGQSSSCRHSSSCGYASSCGLRPHEIPRNHFVRCIGAEIPVIWPSSAGRGRMRILLKPPSNVSLRVRVEILTNARCHTPVLATRTPGYLTASRREAITNSLSPSPGSCQSLTKFGLRCWCWRMFR